MSDTALTGNPDADRQILLTLDPNSLNQIEVNHYIYNLTNNNEFWRERLYQRLGLLISDPQLNYKIITKFLDNGQNYEENFYRAFTMSNKLVVKFLLDYGLVNVNNLIDLDYPIIKAIAKNDVVMVKLLLSYPDTITSNERNPDFGTATFALTVAAKYGHNQIVKLLLDDERIDVENSNAFYQAYNHGYYDTAKIILMDPRVHITVTNIHSIIFNKNLPLLKFIMTTLDYPNDIKQQLLQLYDNFTNGKIRLNDMMDIIQHIFNE